MAHLSTERTLETSHLRRVLRSHSPAGSAPEAQRSPWQGVPPDMRRRGITEEFWKQTMQSLEGHAKESDIHAPLVAEVQDEIQEERKKAEKAVADQGAKPVGADEAMLTDDITGLDWKDVGRTRATKIEIPDGVRTEYARILTILLKRACEATDAGLSEAAHNNLQGLPRGSHEDWKRSPGTQEEEGEGVTTRSTPWPPSSDTRGTAGGTCC